MLEFLGLFLFISGFIIGLGAVTVIEFHGWLARKSAYWTEATTRTHKITKPLIWLGLFMAIIGGTIFYSNNKFSPIIIYHSVLAFIMVLNGLFLSFYVSPILLKKEKEGKEKELLSVSLQTKITISFLISIIGWWSSVALLVLYLL